METEKADSNKVVAQVRKELEQLLVHLNVAHVNRSPVNKLARLLMKELVKDLDAVVYCFGYDAGSWFRQEIETAYSTVCEPYPAVLTRVSGVAATSLRWNGEEGGDVKEAGPTEGRPAETRHGSAKATHPRAPGKERHACC